MTIGEWLDEVETDRDYAQFRPQTNPLALYEGLEWVPTGNDKVFPNVPNYFWKVVLKVNKSGNTVTSASAIGFWFDHKTYTDDYSNYAISVNQIESWTGFDFFVNLPDNVENSAESNTSWSAFQSF